MSTPSSEISLINFEIWTLKRVDRSFLSFLSSSRGNEPEGDEKEDINVPLFFIEGMEGKKIELKVKKSEI